MCKGLDVFKTCCLNVFNRPIWWFQIEYVTIIYIYRSVIRSLSTTFNKIKRSKRNKPSIIIYHYNNLTSYRHTSSLSRTKSQIFLVSSCRCLYPIHWSQVWSREWRCSWGSANRRCSHYIWVIKILLPIKGRLILEVWRYVFLCTLLLKTDITVDKMFCIVWCYTRCISR